MSSEGPLIPVDDVVQVPGGEVCPRGQLTVRDALLVHQLRERLAEGLLAEAPALCHGRLSQSSLTAAAALPTSTRSSLRLARLRTSAVPSTARLPTVTRTGAADQVGVCELLAGTPVAVVVQDGEARQLLQVALLTLLSRAVPTSGPAVAIDTT